MGSQDHSALPEHSGKWGWLIGECRWGWQAVAEYFVMNLSHFATQAVSNILWGCAVLNFYDQDMFNAAALEIQRMPRPREPLQQLCMGYR